MLTKLIITAMTKIPTSDIEDELAKLEQTTFGTEFSNDDTNTRIKRLNSAQKAKKKGYRQHNG